ncbi:metallo-beta-lactamase domain-containing protein 1-like isoform X2 [Pseudorasbora parva]|uniref:metallo-beta-lactamase domain-containing protein 1-like isoform X2 n=2 Tax=Pseudorasbora parva TaxID=51549 RepID=UPI00351F63CE
MDVPRSIRKSESGISSNISGHPYCVSVLKEGYCTAEPDGSFKADGTISLITGPQTILVDTGGPWDRDFLVEKLKEKGMTPDSVAIVVGTHGHSDHVGNLGLFPDAKIIVGCDISVGDRYLPNQLAEGQPYPIDNFVSVIPTPGHMGRDVSVLVKGTSEGTVLVAGDLFERCHDEDTWKDLSENPQIQETNRQKQEAEGLYRLTDEIKFMGGVVGGGILVLIPAIHIHSTGRQGCCSNRCGMFLSIIFAAIGVVGALYSGVVAVLALINGPVCMDVDGQWSRPFKNSTENYLGNTDIWENCKEPENVVEFNIGLFATLLVAACLELLLCGFQVINGLFGCICGTCNHKEVA